MPHCVENFSRNEQITAKLGSDVQDDEEASFSVAIFHYRLVYYYILKLEANAL